MESNRDGGPPDVLGPQTQVTTVSAIVDTRPQLVTQQSTIWTKRQQAVCVRHAFKHYGSNKNPNHVLSNLNMTCAKGTM